MQLSVVQQLDRNVLIDKLSHAFQLNLNANKNKQAEKYRYTYQNTLKLS